MFDIRNAKVIMGAIMAMIVWYLDLLLPMQAVPITTEVSSNPSQPRWTRYNI